MKKTLLNGGGKPFIREMFYNEFISAVTAFTMLKMEYKLNKYERIYKQMVELVGT